MPIKLEIVTPEAKVFSDEVETVVLPGYDGELGILPMHAPLVTTIKPGDLQYTKSGVSTDLAVGDGLVEITGSHVRVLTDMAIGVDDIDEKAVEEALARAQSSLANLKTGDQQAEVSAAMASIQRATAQLAVKRRRKNV